MDIIVDNIKKIEWIEGRTYSDVFRFKSDPLRALRVSYYNQKLLEDILEVIPKSMKKAKDMIETDPIRIENKMALIIDALIKREFHPLYVQQIKNVDCKDFLTIVAPAIPPARRDILLNAKNKELQKRYNNVQVFNRYSVNMTKFLVSNKDDFQEKTLIFEVLYGLGILQMYIKGFRHGNLTTSSVLLEKKKNTLSPVEYTIPGTSRVFLVPDFGFRARISDFDYASGSRVDIKGLEHLSLKNFKTEGRAMMPKDCDVVYFLKSVKTTCPETRAFVKRAAQLGKENENAVDVLLDPYFDILMV
jgi:hypothetical protein